MRRRLIKWYYHRRFVRAYVTLRKMAVRHMEAGHEVYFNATSPTNIAFSCAQCPEVQPLRRSPEDIERVSIGRMSRSYRKPIAGPERPVWPVNEEEI